MAKTTTATTQTAAPAAKVTKMTLARDLYRQVTATPAPEGKSHRGIFIERAESIGLSKPAANTYFQKLKNEVEGATTNSEPGLRQELQEIRTLATELNSRLGAVAKKVA